MRAPLRARGPTARDVAHLGLARASARLAVDRAGRAMVEAVDAAFRDEVAATVRYASAFLAAMLEHERLGLDVLLASFAAPRGWPKRPRVPVSADGVGAGPRSRSSLRALREARPVVWPDPADLGGVDVSIGSVGRLRVHVVDHTVEVAGEWSGLTVATLFGVLRVGMPPGLPESLRKACVGRPLADVVEHPALRGSGWLIEEVVPDGGPGGWALLCRTGSVRCRFRQDLDVDGVAGDPF